MRRSTRSLLSLGLVNSLLLSSAWARSNTLILDASFKSLGCRDFRSQIFDVAYALLRNGAEASDLQGALKGLEASGAGKSMDLPAEESAQLSRAMSKLWSQILAGPSHLQDSFDAYELYKSIIGAEIGDSTSVSQIEFNQSIEASIDEVSALAKKYGVSCRQSSVLAEQLERSQAPGAGEGALRFFKIFYQDCHALDSAPYGDEHIDLKGVSIVGRHPAGGNKRVISNLSDVLSTHYHLKRGGEYGSQCFNWRSSPPIYDFGGKPYASSTHLDFFTNAGSGTNALGIDCSGVVISALASVGRRLKKDVVFKPDFVHNVSSSMLKEPQSNGLSCLEKASFTSSDYNMKPGDILAISGHVTIVSEVGEDPWGLNRFSSVASCKLSNMNTANFDFKIIQSAPVKGAIGVTRMEASHYYVNSGSQGQALRSHALNACFAKFGSSTRTSVSYLSIVRHKEEDGCLQETLPFVSQECVSECL